MDIYHTYSVDKQVKMSLLIYMASKYGCVKTSDAAIKMDFKQKTTSSMYVCY